MKSIHKYPFGIDVYKDKELILSLVTNNKRHLHQQINDLLKTDAEEIRIYNFHIITNNL